MIPVDQTTFGFPGGNCFSACVATLLGLPLEEVPYFMEPEDTWWERFLAWLRPRGLYALCLKLDGAEWAPAGYHVLSGQSPRKPDDPDAHHSVVAHWREIVHDPHPSRAGLLTRRDVIVLIPLLPQRVPSADLKELVRTCEDAIDPEGFEAVYAWIEALP